MHGTILEIKLVEVIKLQLKAKNKTTSNVKFKH